MAFPFAGLKKQLNKANQYMSERITGVEGTKLDSEFQEMERKTDVFNELVEDLQLKTKEFLQPNPTVRAKMAAVKSISKLSGQAKASTYPQPEGTLGEAMSTYGRKLQDFDPANVFGASLMEVGESLKLMADLKYSLDDNVKQNFLEPLHQIQSKDLKEVMHHRKKLQGRKLDFDCKKRKGATEEEIRMSEDKFAESLQLAQLGMHNLLDGSGVEHISQLTQFAEALLDYHKNCSHILKGLTEQLSQKTNQAAAKPKADFRPKTLGDLGIERVNSDSNLSGGGGGGGASLYRPAGSSFNNSHNNNNATLSHASTLISTSPGTSPADTPSHHSSRTSPAFMDLAWPQHPPAGTAPSSILPPPPGSAMTRGAKLPSCVALYDFEADNSSELSFKEGDMIFLKAQVDDNWFEGTLNGRTGYFPVTYVNVVVPLSK